MHTRPKCRTLCVTRPKGDSIFSHRPYEVTDGRRLTLKESGLGSEAACVPYEEKAAGRRAHGSVFPFEGKARPSYSPFDPLTLGASHSLTRRWPLPARSVRRRNAR